MKKEKIFQVAWEHFFAKRYKDVKLDNIANSLNIRKPSLYYYFNDKKDLFLQTLKYSMDLYIQKLKNIVSEKDLEKFVHWYLKFPTDTKNVFAVAFQKWYCTDKDINSTIFSGKMIVEKTIQSFLKEFWWNNVKIYLVMNLLEKLAQDNCMDDYCLMYPIEEIYSEIKKILENN